VSTRFLTASHHERGLLWASYDPDALSSAPAVCDRRFGSYLAPHASEAEARQALLEAGCDPRTIAPEPERRGKRGRR
jgi:hypothetical protein